MTPRTILITGSTDGIGKLAAAKLAQAGHHVYLHGRNAEKLQNVIAELQEQTGNAHIGGFVADFSDMAAVQRMADEVAEQLPTLDVLINNAGIFKTPVERTKDGLDIRFAVNYFAPYLLTHALLPLLKKSASTADITQKPRIINLSSAAQAPVNLDALAGTNPLPANAAYAQSKLALTMWSFALAQQEASVNTISVNPGSLLNTNMVKEAFGQHWSSADKGASLLHDLAAAPEFENESGKYFDNDKGQGEQRGDFGQAHSDAYDVTKVQALLERTKTVMTPYI